MTIKSRIALASFWLASMTLCLLSLDLRNDQFGRISPGRQILMSGEVPFRDFMDPGYFLTEYSSAAVQRLFGQNLLGEILLDSFCIATGSLLVVVLARRATGRIGVSLAAGALALLSMPRAYDYDKVLFYPLGLWLVWRWLDSPTRSRLALAASGLVVAALYRYDNGVFLALASGAGTLALGWSPAWHGPRRAASLALTTLVVSLPVFLFLATHGGIVNAADQALAYGIREGNRTRITSWPRISTGNRLAAFNPRPASRNRITVRWSPAVTSERDRHEAAARLGLENGQASGPPELRTWTYLLPDASTASIRRLVNDPAVEDTGGIDRSTLTLLEPEPRWLAVERAVPPLRIRMLPDAWTEQNAEALLFYLLLLIPLVSVLLLPTVRDECVLRAQLTSAIVLCVLLDIFILRDPISARVGGMAGPFAVLGAWIAVSARRLRPGWRSPAPRTAARTAAFAVVLLIVWSLSSAMNWSSQIGVPDPRQLGPRLARFAETPPALDLLPTGRVAGMIRYIKQCTAPSDRVFISWFLPEVFYFAQREFGGGISAMFGSHWSEERFQRRSLAAFEAHATPVLIFQNHRYDTFRKDYPLLDDYFSRKYKVAGTTSFADPEVADDEYRVMIPVDGAAEATGPFGLPCPAGQR